MDQADQVLVDELNQLRLDEDRSYADLGKEIGIDPGALHKILNGRAEPYDRTMAKVRRFLERQRELAKRAPKRKAS